MRKIICHGIAINKKTGKQIRFTVPATFPEESVEKLRTNLEIKRINGTNLPKFEATTTGICYMIRQELLDERSKKLGEELDVQGRAERRARREQGLQQWQKDQLVADVVVRENEILSGEKTFDQVLH